MSYTLSKRGIASFLIVLFAYNLYAIEKKVALIWGNSTYNGQWQSLSVVSNDAKTINGVFASLGYQTKIMCDGNLEQMKSSLKDFASLAKNADIAVFYYSGHAIRINDNYYLVPAKTALGNDLLSSDLLPAQDIITAIRQCRLKLLFFDSCRDDATIEGVSKGNPNIISSNDAGPISNNESNLPSGTMICYAAERGQKVYTGFGTLSPFTKALSEHLTDGDEFRTVWANVINEVYLSTKKRPVNDGFYQHDLYLNPSGNKHIAPSQDIVQKENRTTVPTTKDKKSISIIPNVSGAKIDFYGTSYDAGKPLLFELGKKYTYTITADGYKTFVGNLEVTEATPSTINLTLKKSESAIFRVTSNANAKVLFDGKYVGNTPINIKTTSGTHTLSLSANKYYEYSSNIDLDAGANSKYISLTRKTSWFFRWNNSDVAIDYASYMYSPKYPIGLQYLHRFEDSYFLFGGIVALSSGLFRGMDLISATSVSQSVSISIGTTSSGTSTGIQEQTSTIDISDEPYSNYVDPYNEAKHYDANALLLANLGYNLCNGIILEAGIGAAYHQDRYYMGQTYSINKTTRTNTITGEVTELPYEYVQQPTDKWYKENGKWSIATRFGTKFLIPLSSYDENFITLGGGYTFIFANHKYNSWDVNIGYSWNF